MFPGKKGTDVNGYLGSRLNLCVTTADFPLHFSQEYSISSAYVKTEQRPVEQMMHHTVFTGRTSLLAVLKAPQENSYTKVVRLC